MFDIFIKSIQDAAPVLMWLFELYVIALSAAYVFTRPVTVPVINSEYRVAIGAHKKRLSALE